MSAHKAETSDGWIGQPNVRMLAVASATLLLSGLLWFNYSAVLPTIVERWGLSGVGAGVVYGAFQAGYLLAVIPFGAPADRYAPEGHAIPDGLALAANGFRFDPSETHFEEGTTTEWTFRIVNWCHSLDTVVEVSLHRVCGADVVPLVPSVVEVEDSREGR